MKFKDIFFSIALLPTIVIAQPMHHLPLELSHQQYHKRLQQYISKHHRLTLKTEIAQAISGGEKLAKWISLINKNREPQDKIYLTSKETSHGIPINSPNIYGPKQIKDDLQKLQQSLPAAIKEVVYGQVGITDVLPIYKQLFINHGRKIDSLYQTAVRWQTVIVPNKSWYQQQKQNDVRGYYHLLHTVKLDKKLGNFSKLNQKYRQQLKADLLMICQNNLLELSKCKNKLAKAINYKNLIEYKNSYWPLAEKNYQSFFAIDNPRHDLQNSLNNMVIPFEVPESNRLQNWLQINVEDEFKYNDWKLKINFKDKALSHLEFEANTTPHVSDGNTIVMDLNTNIDEYEVKWTIRHEFGHVLRLPDCYIEFYDPELDHAINYQIDINDLMCSRAGNMNKRIYTELLKTYIQCYD